ncbi:diaminopimelate epimerase [Bacteroidota bacterium]
MLIQFSKYQGTGNDFVMIDNRVQKLQLSQMQVAQLCNRRFGIGADGLILLQMEQGITQMVYYNADGREGSMCGNGGRCFVRFAQSLNVVEQEGMFTAVDGNHAFKIEKDLISIKMCDVDGIEHIGDDVFLDTGSPHYVQLSEDVLELDIVKEGRSIRYNQRFEKEGTNVNFVEMMDGVIHIRTYERGVEDETLSCGTGATACAIAMHHLGQVTTTELPIKVLGGKLKVSFEPNSKSNYSNIWLSGPAESVFNGTINLAE